MCHVTPLASDMTILLIFLITFCGLSMYLSKLNTISSVNPAHQLGINKHFYLKPLAAKYDFKVKQERRLFIFTKPHCEHS